MLTVYNTLTQTKTLFKPITIGKVNIYVCGMTVYDFCHLGHARALVAFDVIVRYLKHLNYDVNFVRNITDIDDKIIKRANENGEYFLDLTGRFINAMHEDCANLNLLTPNKEPRATEYIPQIIQTIERLIEKGFAYVGKNGDVYYNIRKFKEYGKLSHRNLDDLQSGARIDISEAKNDPLDFALWKLAKPSEPCWDSPWGKGRPGWHIECSAMSKTCLAETIDIHGGGMDLIFPHHENEIAQSEALTGKPLAHYWMHCGHLQIDKTKMSKSLGNFLTIKEVLKSCDAETLRYLFISAHYRSPIHYSEDSIKNARQALERLYTVIRGSHADLTDYAEETDYEKRFIQAMNDDFNTPEALAVLFDLTKEINRSENKAPLQSLLKYLAGILGLLQQDPENFFQGDIKADEIEQLIKDRNEARKNKNFKRSDQIRNQLMQKGILLEDTAQGTIWKKQN